MKTCLLAWMLAWFAWVVAPLGAAETSFVYLDPVAVDAVHLVPAPPALVSPEHVLDFDNTRAVHASASVAALALGKEQDKLSPFHYAAVIGPWFTPKNCPRTEALFKQIEAEAKAISDAAKASFKRPRPYHLAPALFPHAIEHEDPTHYSYPSGHSTRGTLFALVLADLLPEKREALLAKGRESGWLRVQGGVHYPLDVFAGRVLGQALARELLKNPSFQRDLALVRAEIAAQAPRGTTGRPALMPPRREAGWQ